MTEKRGKRNEQSLQEIWDYVKRPNLRLIGVPECEEENESKLENTLQDIIQENFPNLARQANIQVQEIQRTPQRFSSRRATPRHIIVRFTRVEMKEKMLRAAREKGRVTHKGKPIRLTADLSAETLQARREWGPTFNILKEKNFQPRISYPVKLSFISEGKINFFANKQVLRDYITTRPALQELLKEALHMDGNNQYQPFQKHTKRISLPLLRLECSGMISAHCSLDLLSSGDPSSSASQVAETTVETRFSPVAQAGLKLLGPSDLPALTFQNARIGPVTLYQIEYRIAGRAESLVKCTSTTQTAPGITLMLPSRGFKDEMQEALLGKGVIIDPYYAEKDMESLTVTQSGVQWCDHDLLELLGSSNPPTSASRIAGTINRGLPCCTGWSAVAIHRCDHIVHHSLELLASSGLPASVSSAAGTTGMHHHVQHIFKFLRGSLSLEPRYHVVKKPSPHREKPRSSAFDSAEISADRHVTFWLLLKYNSVSCPLKFSPFFMRSFDLNPFSLATAPPIPYPEMIPQGYICKTCRSQRYKLCGRPALLCSDLEEK
ncbi:LINE-1 retrotransposable element ORF1 protein [Plecturocebus cupreus]